MQRRPSTEMEWHGRRGTEQAQHGVQRLAHGGGAARIEHRHGHGKSVRACTEGAAVDRVCSRRGKPAPTGGGVGQRRPRRAEQGKERALWLGVSMSSKQKRGEGSACAVAERRQPEINRKRKGEREGSNASRRQTETGTRKSGHRQKQELWGSLLVCFTFHREERSQASGGYSFSWAVLQIKCTGW